MYDYTCIIYNTNLVLLDYLINVHGLSIRKGVRKNNVLLNIFEVLQSHGLKHLFDSDGANQIRVNANKFRKLLSSERIPTMFCYSNIVTTDKM